MSERFDVPEMARLRLELGVDVADGDRETLRRLLSEYDAQATTLAAVREALGCEPGDEAAQVRLVVSEHRGALDGYSDALDQLERALVLLDRVREEAPSRPRRQRLLTPLLWFREWRVTRLRRLEAHHLTWHGLCFDQGNRIGSSRHLAQLREVQRKLAILGAEPAPLKPADTPRAP